MNTEKMKIREFLTRDVDIDVYDDYDEELGIAFCGPMFLTEEGKKEFGDLLDKEIEIFWSENYSHALVHAENDREVRKWCELFESLAGYCAEDDYEKWFREEIR